MSYNEIELHNELIRDEGICLNAYKDTRGFWTIGVGHLLGKDKRMSTITPNEAVALLQIDIQNALAIVRSCIPRFIELDDVRQRALINMAFNRGNNMKTSSTITPAINKAIDTGDWSHIEAAGMNSQWAEQVGNRANRLLHMLVTGEAL